MELAGDLSEMKNVYPQDALACFSLIRNLLIDQAEPVCNNERYINAIQNDESCM